MKVLENTINNENPVLEFAASQPNTQHSGESKVWLTLNRYNMPDWRDMSTTGVFFLEKQHYKIPAKRVGLVQSGHHRNVTCSRHDTEYLARN
jgi:hypothetical protein